jgi:hypothetical protein
LVADGSHVAHVTNVTERASGSGLPNASWRTTHTHNNKCLPKEGDFFCTRNGDPTRKSKERKNEMEEARTQADEATSATEKGKKQQTPTLLSLVTLGPVVSDHALGTVHAGLSTVTLSAHGSLGSHVSVDTVGSVDGVLAGLTLGSDLSVNAIGAVLAGLSLVASGATLSTVPVGS